jgi:diguanylate cyclase (GGDEF)-like protein
MIDIDYFKLYNDYYGHQMGDDCLRAVATALQTRILRPYDLLARYGGEEFVCLLPETDLDGAFFMARALLETVKNLKVEHVRSNIDQYVSISLGVSSEDFSQAHTPEDLIRHADSCLYQAKLNGRRQVCG